jgi:rhamnose utilization protein RhaD (predicted bifunctional aldolase and dehydrogenase)
VYVPYSDPGPPLARAIREGIESYIAEWGAQPRSVLIQNHGLVALGTTALQVEAITATWVKAARILIGTMAFGGPRFMSDKEVERIHTRPDEAPRHRSIMGTEQ